MCWDAKRSWGNGFFLDVGVQFSLPSCVQFLWPFSATEAEGAGAQCQMLSSVTSPGMQVKARDGEWPLLLPEYLFLSWYYSSPGLLVDILEVERLFIGSSIQRPGWDQRWQSNRYKGKNVVPISLRAGRRNLCLHWWTFKFPKSIKKEDFLWVLLFLGMSSQGASGEHTCYSVESWLRVWLQLTQSGSFWQWHFNLTPK